MKPELEEQIQALVDGELDHKERKDLLENIGREAPQQWRTLALGFVENQMLREGLGGIHRAKANHSTFPAWLKIAAVMALGVFSGYFLPRQSPPPMTPEHTAESAEPSVELDTEVSQLAQSRIERISDAVSEKGFNPVLETTLIQADLGDGRSLVIPLNRLLIASNQ